MATLYVSEYSDIVDTVRGSAPMARAPAVAEQTVAISGTSTQSSAFNALTRYVRIHTDAVCSITFGSNPTATATLKRLAADQTEYFGVIAGDKVAVISNT